MFRRLPLLRTERTLALALLRERRTVAQACEAVDRAHAFAATAIAEDLRDDPPARPQACAAGCSWCCHSRVVLTEAEVLRIEAYLRAHLSASQLEAVRLRVRHADDLTRGLTTSERFAARIPCPLLEDGLCSVHTVRPLACVAYNSSDAAVCERALREGSSLDVIPAYGPQVETAAAVQMGLVQGLRDAGLRGSALELNAALRIALDRDGVGERWLAGRHPFAAAVTEEGQQNLDRVLDTLRD